MKNELLEQFLAGQPQYSVAELQEQLNRLRGNKGIDISDIKKVLSLLASNRYDKRYFFNVYEVTGNFERQAYLLEKSRKEGVWKNAHGTIFNILAHCARIEPRLIIEKPSFFFNLLNHMVNNK